MNNIKLCFHKNLEGKIKLNLAFKWSRKMSTPVIQEAEDCWWREKSVYFIARQQRLFTGQMGDSLSEDNPEDASFYGGLVFIYKVFI